MEQIKLIKGHWHVNYKRLNECNEQERVFFGKFIRLNEFASHIFNN